MKRFLSVAVIIAVISGCSSGKKDQSYVGKVYHNTTSHYNGYYYAKLKMTESENSVLASRKEDYDKLLPIFMIGNPEDQFSNSDMDSIIKRLTVVVKLHPKSKWVNDCYFMIGKSYFYKKDYESAAAAFQLVSSQFNDQNQSSTASHSSSHGKKKKSSSSKSKDKDVNQYTGTTKETKESSGFKMLGHKPIHYTDVLWLVRSEAMLKNFGEAQAILSYLDNDSKFPVDKKADLALMHSFVFAEQKQYRNAEEPMKEGIKLTKNKKAATRYTYILAQLYQYAGDYGTAGKTFASISQMRPSYEMDFYSRISVVKNYVASGSGSPSQIVEDLEAMAKNTNFKEFNDQIYYYIGLVHLKQGKDEEAIKDFESSISSSVSNSYQKGLSFLKIGEMMMGDQDYLTAAPYYDSAVVFLTEKFDTLDRVKDIQSVLNQLAHEMQIITAEDSLQKLAQMSDKDRKRIIDQMVAKQQQENAQEQEESNVTNVFNNQQNNTAGNQSAGGTWYFYNATLRSGGYNDFLAKWGPRVNEDNWRRSNKKTSGSSSQDQTAQNEKSDSTSNDSTAKSSDALAKQLMANIPLTPEKLSASEKKVFDAYYAMARIYQNDLNNTAKAIATYESMVKRFEHDSDLAKVYYNLYLIYSETGNTTAAESNRQKILQQFSGSVYASVLLDPDYFKKKQDKENAVNAFYASTYNDFTSNNFTNVLQRVKTADTLFKPNPLKPKFDLLQAMAIGHVQDRNAYIAALDT
ncbi:MAG: tetratricopeptide repeat protein, partial [Chitinophagales bacterium]